MWVTPELHAQPHTARETERRQIATEINKRTSYCRREWTARCVYRGLCLQLCLRITLHDTLNEQIFYQWAMHFTEIWRWSPKEKKKDPHEDSPPDIFPRTKSPPVKITLLKAESRTKSLEYIYDRALLSAMLIGVPTSLWKGTYS